MARRNAHGPTPVCGVRASTVAAGLVALCVVTLCADAAPEGVLARNGDVLGAEIDAPGDSDAFSVELAAGGRLDLSVAAAEKSSALLPEVVVLDPSGNAVAPAKFKSKKTGHAVQLGGIVAPDDATGVWRVLVAARDDTVGTYTASFKVKNPAKGKAAGIVVPAAGVARIPFAAEGGAVLTSVVVKPGKGLPTPAAARIVAPDGSTVPASEAAFAPQGTSLRLRKFELPAGDFGAYALEVVGGGSATTVQVKLAQKPPKRKARKKGSKPELLPPEARIDALDATDARQEDAPHEFVITGAGFLAESTAAVSGDGVTFRSFTLDGDGTARIACDVVADAPYGLRDLTLLPPPLLGEPVRVVRGVRVLAPLPTIAGTPTPVVKQEDAAAEVVLTGSGFRAGGSVSFGGAGLTVTALDVESGGRIVLGVRVDGAAPLGARDVTYTQPAAGGGDAVVATGLLTVHYPDPVVSAATPTIVRQGDTGVDVVLAGGGFRDGASALVGGAGVDVTAVARDDGTHLRVTVDVADDAAYGARDVSVTQADLGGGATGIGSGVLTVHAPDPVLTSVAPAALTQGDTDVQLTLRGAHLRNGGTVGIGGTGFTVTGFTRVADDEVHVLVSAADDATLGALDVTYTQPDAGGGASATLAAALQVDAPQPTLTESSASVLRQLDTQIELVLTGTEFRDGATVRISGSGVTVAHVDVASRTSATVTLSVDEFAAVGARDVTFVQPAIGGARSATLADAFAVHHPDPLLSVVDPAQVRRTKTGTLRLFGAHFRTGGSVTASGSGVTFGTPTVIDPATLDVAYAVSAGATLDTRDVTYAQPAAGGGAQVTLADGLEVFDSPPLLTSITPATLRPGDAFVPCVVIGDRFVAGTQVSIADGGVVVEALAVTSATRLDLIVSAASDAALGPADVSIALPTGPAEVFDDAFAVLTAPPVVQSFSMAAVVQGAASVPVELRGLNLARVATLTADGSGVTFANVVAVDDGRVTADVSATAAATLGLRTLTATNAASTGGGSGTLAAAFEVVGATPTVSTVTPAAVARTPSAGRTRVVAARVLGSNFVSGASVALARAGGSGVAVVSGSARVLSGGEIAVDVSVAGGATTGAWDVTVTNPGGLGDSGASGAGTFTVQSESTLTLNQIVPPDGSTYGGERVVLHGGGFATGAVVDFGTERALRAQVIDQNTIVCTVPQPATASLSAPSAVAVTVTNPSTSTASRGAAYAYAVDDLTQFVDVTVPALGATGVPASLAASCVHLARPAAALPAYSGSSATFPELTLYWYENAGAGAPGGAATLSADRRWIVFTRSTASPLAASAAGVWKTTIPGTVTSLAGQPLFEVSKTDDGGQVRYDEFFYTIAPASSDTTAPTLLSSTPGASASGVSTTAALTLAMSEELDPLSATSANISLTQGATPVGCHVGIAADLRTLMLSPHAELATSTTYTVTLSTGVRDLHGNALASNVTFTFTTSNGTDATAPTIDRVTIEDLPAAVDGSGTYVSGADSTGSSTNPQAASAGASQAFDLFVPQSGFAVRVEYSDEGGAGIDPTGFTALCSVASGSASAGTDLAASFDTVDETHAVWRIPAGAALATGENVTLTFTVSDTAGNTSSNAVVTFDVGAASATSASATGGNLAPFDARQTWVLRSDLDVYTASIFEETVGSTTFPRMTTTLASNDIADFDEVLRLVGLQTTSMTSAAAATVNGESVGTNRIVRRLLLERVRELLRERFGIDGDGTRDADAPEIEFLLAGEQGSLTTLPTYASSASSGSTSGFSELSIGGTQGAESSGTATSSVLGASPHDTRNLAQEALLNTDGTYGVFLGSLLKRHAGDGRFTLAGTSQAWRGMYRPFGRYVLEQMCSTWGGTPVGEDASDDDVLAGTFDRTTSVDTTLNDRYDAVFTALETLALYISATAATEIGNATGLVPDGAPKTGLFGHAHRDNAFTDATTSALNVSHRVYWAGVNNLMAPDGTIFERLRTGSDLRRFNPLALAWLRGRLLHDEGL